MDYERDGGFRSGGIKKVNLTQPDSVRSEAKFLSALWVEPSNC